jgi:hypothetical protein
MPTARSTGNHAYTIRRNMLEYLNLFATTVTLIKPNITKDSQNRVLTKTETESTIKADIQWVNKEDLDHLGIGNAEVGDGMLFTKYDADIDIEDEVEFGGERWRVDTQIEGEQVSGLVVYQGFLIKRNKQS